MALSVTSNFAISAGYASNNMRGSQSLMGKSINRISSGHRAANPADDIASYVGGTKLKGDSKGYAILSTGIQNVAAKLNMQDTILSDVTNGLLELKAQAVSYQATNETQEQSDLDKAFKATLAGITAMNSAQYKNEDLFNSANSLKAFYGFAASALVSINASILSFPSQVSTSLSIDSISGIDNALQAVTTRRAALGGNISALEQISNYLSDVATSAEAAYSAVTEVDMAREMTSYVKNNIQSQASQAMVAQANQSLAQVLNLLQV